MGVTLSAVGSTHDDSGTTLTATVGFGGAGTADVIVLDATGHEIDRAHVRFVAPATLACGQLGAAVSRTLEFPGLVTSGTVSLASASSPGILACRAEDAGGAPLLTVDAIHWEVQAGSHGTISVTSDDAFETTPALGATARVVTSGMGDATIQATLGTLTTDIAVTFH